MELGLLGILVVNAGAFGFAYLMRSVCPQVWKNAYLGYYLVLMPIGLSAWTDPELWLDAGIAMIGLVLITLSARKVMKQTADRSPRPGTASGDRVDAPSLP